MSTTAIHNAYPELPVVDYEHTTVTPAPVIAYLKEALAPPQYKRIALVIFNNESGHGKHGVNNNYTGLQADGARLGGEWDKYVIATCLVKENTTGNMRRFCVFESFETCIAYLIDRVAHRGLYMGGYAHPYAKFKIFSEKDLARAYYKEWVMGDSAAEPSNAAMLDFIKQYEATATLFN